MVLGGAGSGKPERESSLVDGSRGGSTVVWVGRAGSVGASVVAALVGLAVVIKVAAVALESWERDWWWRGLVVVRVDGDGGW